MEPRKSSKQRQKENEIFFRILAPLDLPGVIQNWTYAKGFNGDWEDVVPVSLIHEIYSLEKKIHECVGLQIISNHLKK